MNVKFLIITSILLSFYNVFALEDLAYCNTCNKSDRICECAKFECKKCCSYPCCCPCKAKASTPCPTNCGYNAPYRPGTCLDIFATGSFVYWHASEDGLEIGRQVLATTPTVSTSFITDLKCEQVDFAYNPGFKLGFGVHFDCDFWDLYAEYTWYHHSIDTCKNHSLISNWLLEEHIFENIDSKWELSLDMLDIELTRTYYVGCKLLLRPNIGLRMLWIDQKHNLEHTDGLNNTPDLFSKNSSCSWGIGIKAGLNTRWNFCKSFYLYGDVNSSILYTSYDMLIHTDFFSIPGELATQNLTCDLCVARPEIELSLGFGWSDYCDVNNNWYLFLFIGYEFYTFFDQNLFRNYYVSNQAQSNLYLHGLTITAKIDF